MSELDLSPDAALKANVALALLPTELLPHVASHPSVQALLQKPLEYTFRTGDGGPSFPLSAVFSAYRAALSGVDAHLPDNDGNTWSVEASDGDTRSVRMRCGERTASWHYWFLLSPDRDDRLGGFANATKRMFLADGRDRWVERLARAPMENSDVLELLDDLEATTWSWTNRFEEALRAGPISEEDLVPREEAYYRRLVGNHADGDFGAYSGTALKVHAESLLSWDPVSGAHELLGIAGQRLVVDELRVRLPDTAAEALIEWGRGAKVDSLTKVGAFELAMLCGSQSAVDAACEIVDDITDGASEVSDGATLSSHLFVLVDGVLARRRTLGSAPPFYRRLAALAHASRIERVLRGVNADTKRLAAWAVDHAAESFYLRSLLDLQIESRWHPEYGSPIGFQMEWLGRMAHAVQLLDSTSTQLPSRLLQLPKEALEVFPGPFRAGPLEGATPPSLAPPDDLGELVQDALSDGPMTSSSFAVLTNAASVCKLEAQHSALATAAIREANHLIGGNDAEEIEHILGALALVAASTRNEELAQELRLAYRRAARMGAIDVSAMSLLSLVLVAGAAHADRSVWRRFVGEWLYEIAHTKDSGEVTKELWQRLRALRLLEDELLPQLAPVITALELAVNP